MSRATVLIALNIFVVIAATVAAEDPVKTAHLDLVELSRASREAEQKLLQLMHQKIDAQWTEVPLNELLTMISAKTLIPISIDRQGLQADGLNIETPITLNLGEITIWQAMHFMLRPLGIAWTSPDGILVVTSQTKAEDQLQTRVYDVAAIVKVLEPQLHSEFGAPRGWAQTPHPAIWISGSHTELVLAHMLDKLFVWELYGKGLSVLPGQLVVRHNQETHFQIQSLLNAIEVVLLHGAKVKGLKVERPGYPEDDDAQILRRLTEPVTIDSANQPLEQILAALTKPQGIRHWIDRQALQDDGIKFDVEVTSKHQGTILAVALKQLLDPLRLTFIVREGTLVVTPQNIAEQLASISVYNTADLPGITPQSLSAAIEKCTSEDWRAVGVQDTLGLHLRVIRQNHRGHTEIATLLEDIRKSADPKQEPATPKLEQRIYNVMDQSATGDLVKSLPELIPFWDSKQGSIHRLGNALMINQSARVHARVQEIISTLNDSYRQLNPLPRVRVTTSSADIDPVGRLDVAGTRVQWIRFTPDGQTILVNPLDSKTLYLLTGDRYQILRSIELPEEYGHIACLKESSRCVVFYYQGTSSALQVISLQDGRPLHERIQVMQAVWGAKCSANGEYFGVWGQRNDQSGEFKLFRTNDWSVEATLSFPDLVRSASLSENGDRVRLATSTQILEWSRKTRTVSPLVDVDRGTRFAESFSGDRLIIDPYGAEVLDLSTRASRILPLTLPGEPRLPEYENLTFHNCWIPNTPLAIIGYPYRGFAVWDLSTFKRLDFVQIDRTADTRIWDIAASASGKAIAVCGGASNGFVSVWMVDQFLPERKVIAVP